MELPHTCQEQVNQPDSLVVITNMALITIDLSIGNTSPKWDDYTGNLSEARRTVTENYYAKISGNYIRTLWKPGPNIAEPVSHI